MIPCVQCKLLVGRAAPATHRNWILDGEKKVELYLCTAHAVQMEVHPSLWVWEQLAA